MVAGNERAVEDATAQVPQTTRILDLMWIRNHMPATATVRPNAVAFTKGAASRGSGPNTLTRANNEGKPGGMNHSVSLMPYPLTRSRAILM